VSLYHSYEAVSPLACNSGESSRIASVVQQAAHVLPAEAHTTAALLHASRTWLRPSESQSVAAIIPTLSPTNTVWCFLAMHTPYPSPAAISTALHSSRHLSPSHSTNPDSVGVPWQWIQSSRLAVHRTRYKNHKKLVQGLLRDRIELLSPRPCTIVQSVTAKPTGHRVLAVPPQSKRAVAASSSKLRWPEHAPTLLAGLDLPITRSHQRAALRPLLTASAACIAQCQENGVGFPRGATQTGHWIGLLDLTSTALAAMSYRHHSIAEGLVATACEELQAQVSVLPAHHVASSVLLLGEILTKQV
jgi:hypothetical protein